MEELRRAAAIRLPGRDAKHDDAQQLKYTLNPEEAHRFRAILGEAVERLDLLNLVTIDSSRRTQAKREPAQQSNVRNRQDIVALMVKEKELERQFDHLMHKRWQLQGLSNKSKKLRNQEELKVLQELLVKSSANISQNLKEHPTIVGNLNKIQKDRQELQDLLGSTVSELNGLTFNSLVTLVHERTSKQRELNDTTKKAQATSESLNDVQTRMEEECDRFDKENAHMDKQIAELTAGLKHLKKVTRLRHDFEAKAANARLEAKARIYKKDLDTLRERIRKAEDSLNRDDFVNKKTITFLTRQEETLAKHHTLWEEKLSKEKKEKEDEYDKLKNLQEEEEQFRLSQHKQRWEKEKNRQEALQKEAAQRDREAVAKKRLLKVMALAQCKIRFWWKVHQRHAAAAGKGAGKKKKTKGKKKKKKG